MARFEPVTTMTISAFSRPFARTFTALAFLASLTCASVSEAAPGPGIGNIDCGDNEYFKPFAFVENTSDPKGTNVAVMIRGYFMTVFAPDSGRPPGHIAIYDVSNPKTPNRVKHITGGDTNVFREAHALPIALINGKQYIAFQTTAGMQIWDFTDPLNPSRIGKIDLPGVTGGDYENVAWQSSWQGRYLYVSGGNLGIFVIDTVDPTQPKLLAQIPTGSTGGFRVGPLFALGDYLVISNMDQGGAYAVLDISIPDKPTLLSRLTNQPRMYAIVVGANDRIFTAGRDGDFLNHSFSDPRKITLVKNAKIGQDQLYAATQDHFVFLGRQNNVVKVDMTNENDPKVVGEGNLGRANPDHGQVTPIGNLIFIGNDHGTGSAFFCHQRGKDTTPLSVQSTYPKADATGVGTGARISILMSDFVDFDKVNQDNVIVRPAGGEPIPGIYTYAFNTLSFSPDQPFETDKTYEVVIPAGGLSDAMGNALEDDFVLRFSTGDEIVVPDDEVEAPEEEPATGGAPGAGGGPLVGVGGQISAGGAANSGGAPNAGTGGSSGGALASSGGAPSTATGGAPVSVGGGMDFDPPAGDDMSGGGCSYQGPGSSSSGWALLSLLSLAWVGVRRLRVRRG